MNNVKHALQNFWLMFARWSLFRFSAAPFLDLEWWNESTFGLYCTVVSNSWKHELRPNSWTNPDKSLKSFPPFYSLLPVQLCLEIKKFLQTHATFYVFLQFSYWTLQRRNGGKPDKKTYPLPFGLINPYRNLKSENSQDYAQKP